MSFLFAHCLGVQGNYEEALVWRKKALEIYHRKTKTRGVSKTTSSLSEADVATLIPYDFL